MITGLGVAATVVALAIPAGAANTNKYSGKINSPSTTGSVKVTEHKNGTFSVRVRLAALPTGKYQISLSDGFGPVSQAACQFEADGRGKHDTCRIDNLTLTNPHNGHFTPDFAGLEMFMPLMGGQMGYGTIGGGALS
ncbi:MAG: hypothetical protein ACT4OX_04200 [Actinomycetota bacterium]